jgi:hypothetical protein
LGIFGIGSHPEAFVDASPEMFRKMPVDILADHHTRVVGNNNELIDAEP